MGRLPATQHRWRLLAGWVLPMPCVAVATATATAAGAAVAVAVAIAIAVPAGAEPAGHSVNARQDAVQVTEAWIRWLPAGLPGGGYMTLVAGAAGDSLIGAESPDYQAISFHRSVNRDGRNEMLPVSGIDLPPRVPVHFAAGGYHLMLMQPRRAIAPGDRVTITLRFAHAAPLVVVFDVRAGNEP